MSNFEDRLNDYSILDINEYSDVPKNDEKNVLIKETQLRSPIFTHIYDSFQVNTNKSFQGLASTSINDEADQYLGIPEEDSQMDVFSDDEDSIIADISGIDNTTTSPDEINKQERSKEIILKSIKIIVKHTSILVDGIEYPLSAPVRACCKVPGISDSNSQEEDSLFISLASGFMLLVKIFLVPRSLVDSDHDKYGIEVRNSSSVMLVYKPYVVQWWDTHSKSKYPDIESSGNLMFAHSSGLTAVSTSAANIFRIYNIQHTTNGIQFLPQHNEPTSGIILQAGLSEPDSQLTLSTHVMFLTLLYTESHRLMLVLYSWSVVDPIHESLSKSILPLQNNFRLPVHIVPLSVGEAFLFVNHGELTIITPHSIMSADYQFKTRKFDTAFPTAFYKPSSAIVKDDESSDDEILIATDNGVIYSVCTTRNFDISITPIARVSDPISVFTFEQYEQGYLLIFGCDTGSNRELFIPSLFETSEVNEIVNQDKLPYSSVQAVHDYKNWSPIVDYEIVEAHNPKNLSIHTSQELWTLAGVGRRTRIAQLRDGYNANRTSKVFSNIRKANRIYRVSVGNVDYIACSFSFETLFFSCDLLEQTGEFQEIDNQNLISNSPSLLVASLHEADDFILQVTPERLVITDFSNTSCVLEFEKTKVVFCDKYEDHLVLLWQNSSGFSMTMYQISDPYLRHSSLSVNDFLIEIDEVPIDFEPCTVKVLSFANSIAVGVGGYDEKLRIINISDHHFSDTITTNLKDFDILNDDFGSLILNDIIVLKKELIMGTKNGHFIRFEIKDKDFNVEFSTFLLIGDTPVHFRPVANDNNLLIIISRTVWLLNYYDSRYPRRVSFDERIDKATVDIVPFPSDQLTHKLWVCFAREEGLSLGSILTSRSANVKHVNLADSAKKLIHLPHLNTFCVVCSSKNPKQRLKFIDRRQLKAVEMNEFNARGRLLKDSESIFGRNEVPNCAAIWSVARSDRVSKKLLVGCSVGDNWGSFKVLDVVKSKSEVDEDVIVKVTELTSFEQPGPIRCIRQLEEWIVCSSKRSLFFTTYNPDERKLQTLQTLMNLPSDIVDFEVINKDLHITTKEDSIIVLKDVEFLKSPQKFVYKVFKDPVPKDLINLTTLAKHFVAGEKTHSSILLFDELNDSIQTRTKLTMSGITRVARASFRSYWCQDSTPTILCITVSGEVLTLRIISSNSREAGVYSSVLGSRDSVEELLRRLERPFRSKLTGKCLRSINAPYFSFPDTSMNFIDYDIQEISKISERPVAI